MQPTQAAFITQGHSDYNALKGLNREVAWALESLNVKPIILDLNNGSEVTRVLNEAIQTYGLANLLGVFCFSGVGVEVGDDQPGGNLWARLKLPVLNWLLDHPCHMLARNDHTSPYTINLYGPREFIDFQRNFIRSKRYSAVCRFGVLTGGREAKRRAIKKGEKPLIVFPKSTSDPRSFEKDWAAHPSFLEKLLHEAVDCYWDETPRSGCVMEPLLKVAAANEFKFDDDLRLLSLLFAQLDHYIRSKKSDLLIREAMKFPIRIYGKASEHIDISGAKAEFAAPIDYEEMVKIYHSCNAVISINPNIDDEGHDRSLSAMGSGALPISDVNPWWAKNFPELLPYSYDFRDRPIAAALERVFDDPESAANVAWDVGEKARAERPFVQAVARALEIAASVRFSNLVLAS